MILSSHLASKRSIFWATILSLAVFLLSVSNARAASLCCVCTLPSSEKNVCLEVGADDAANCVGLPTKNEKLKGYNCVAPANQSNCAPKSSASGVCLDGPTPIAAYTPDKGETEPTESHSVSPPLLSTPLPGLKFASHINEKGGYLYTPYLGQYVSAIYRYLTGLSAIAAAIMIVYGGFLTIFAQTGIKIRQGKEIIRDALIGLTLVMGAYVILAVINPNTLKLDAIKTLAVRGEPWEKEEEGNLDADVEGKSETILAPSTTPLPEGATPPSAGTIVLPKAICAGTDCGKYCDGASPKSDLPTAIGIAGSKELVSVPKSAGLKGTAYLRQPAADALVLAGKAANSWPGGPYTIIVRSSSRTLSEQLVMVCKRLASKDAAGIGGDIANPGGSMHGSGLAVDIELWKDSVKLVSCCTVKTQVKDTTQENAKLLQEIMASIGWVRYCHEVWHFEWGTTIAGRSKDCAWPPP